MNAAAIRPADGLQGRAPAQPGAANCGLHLDDAQVFRGTACVLDGVALQLRPSEVLGVLGANGAGKSTMLGAMSGELVLQRGQVRLDAQCLTSLDGARQARRRAVLPQHASLSFPLPVETVVGMGAYPFPELSPPDVERRIADALGQVDLLHKQHASYRSLSGGERQRVQFARVLVQLHAALDCEGGAYLLLDEPVSSLDPRHQRGVLATARNLAQQRGVGVLAVLHDLNLAARWCDRLAVMAQGRILACGTPQEVLTPDILEQAYGLRPSVVAHPVDAGRPLVLFD